MRQTIMNIVRETAEKHRITSGDIMGKNSKRYIARARQEAMYRAFTECPWLSYPELARRLDKHHTSILSGVRSHCTRNGLDYEALSAERLKNRACGHVHCSIRFMLPEYAHTMEVACAY